MKLFRGGRGRTRLLLVDVQGHQLSAPGRERDQAFPDPGWDAAFTPRGSEAARPFVQDVHSTIPAIPDHHGVYQIPNHRVVPGITPGLPDQLRLVLVRACVFLHVYVPPFLPARPRHGGLPAQD